MKKDYKYWDTVEGLREQLLTMCQLFIDAQGVEFEVSHFERYRHEGAEGYFVPCRMIVDVWGEKLTVYTEVEESLAQDKQVMENVRKGLLSSMAIYIQKRADLRKLLLKDFEWEWKGQENHQVGKQIGGRHELRGHRQDGSGASFNKH